MKKPAASKNTRKPIVVTDPNDKRLKAYNDSAQDYRYNPSRRVVELERLNYDYELEQKSGDWQYPLKRKPVQPYVYEKPVSSKVKPKTISKPKPTSKPAPKVESSPKQPQKTVAKEDKKFYQGRAFMDSTGLRPNHYTKSEVNAAVAKKKKK